LYEQAIKPTPAKGGGAEAVAIEDGASTSIDFFSVALDGSPGVDFLKYITDQFTSKPQVKEKD
jgi:hypothetical protein